MPVRRTRLLVPALTLALAGLTAAVSPAWAAETCAGETATVVGTAGDDVLRGTSGRDVIAGLGGADVISGLEGRDLVCGGPGNDEVRAGAGADTLVWNPGDGSDLLTGGAGADRLAFNGSAAAETIELGAEGAVAVLVRDIGAVRLELAGVEDVGVRALAGQDRLRSTDLSGTAVDDVTFDLAGAVPEVGDQTEDEVRFLGSAAPEQVTMHLRGPDVVWELGGTTFVVSHGEGHADPLGAEAPDHVTVDLAGDVDELEIRGTAAPDSPGLWESDSMTGLDVGQASEMGVRVAAERTHVSAGAGDDDVDFYGSWTGVTRLSVDAGPGDDSVTGSGGPDVILGGAGDDRLYGGDGLDRLVLGPGDDSTSWGPGDGEEEILGGDGHDTLRVGGTSAADDVELDRVVRDGVDDVAITQSAAESLLVRGFESVGLQPEAGADTVTTENLRGTALGEVVVDLVRSGGAAETDPDLVVVRGTPGGDRFEAAGDGDAVEVRGAGPRVVADTLRPEDRIRVEGGSGSDQVTVRGTAGDDEMELYAGGGGSSPSADLGLGGPPLTFPEVEHLVADLRGGNDVIDANSDADGVPSMTVLGGGGNDGLFGGLGPDRLVGGPGDDTLAGNGGHDLLDGGAGSDEVDGGDGIDTVDYRRAPKAVRVDLTDGKASGLGSDLLALVEVVLGSARSDVLRGSAGADRLVGGGGDDRLLGLAGDDVLVGGGGVDGCAGGAGTDTARKCERTTGVPRLQSWSW